MNFLIAGETSHNKVPLGHLMKATRAYATAIHCSPKEGNYHIALGLVLEELFYAEDLYGLVPELPLDSEGEAQTSSKEEEFLAICKIHGVPPSAPFGLQLKAVEAEYQSLKETGQAHKADHVQALYAWKSKKVLEVSLVETIIIGMVDYQQYKSDNGFVKKTEAETLLSHEITHVRLNFEWES